MSTDPTTPNTRDASSVDQSPSLANSESSQTHSNAPAVTQETPAAAPAFEFSNQLSKAWQQCPDAPLMLVCRGIPQWKYDAIQKFASDILAETSDTNTALDSNLHSYSPPNKRPRKNGQPKQPHLRRLKPKIVDAVNAAFMYLLSPEYLETNRPSNTALEKNPQGFVSISSLCHSELIRNLNLKRSELDTILRRHLKGLELSTDGHRIRRLSDAASYESISIKGTASSSNWQPSPPLSQSAPKLPNPGGLVDDDGQYTYSDVSDLSNTEEEEVTVLTAPVRATPQEETVTGYAVLLDDGVSLDFLQHQRDPLKAFMGPLGGNYERATQHIIGETYDPTQSLSSGFSRTCFNCGSPEHAVNNCPLPIDVARVKQNRALHTPSQRPVFDGRYHAGDEEIDRRSEWYEKYQPGKYSDTLLEALGINPPEPTDHSDSTNHPDLAASQPVPEFVQRMKRFGYPPGYIGPTPDTDPLHKAKSHEVSFTPLVLYTGDEDEPNIPTSSSSLRPTSSAAPTSPGEVKDSNISIPGLARSISTPVHAVANTTQSVYYPLVKFPGLDLNLFSFTSDRPGRAKNPPAIWRHTPQRPSPGRNYTADNYHTHVHSRARAHTHTHAHAYDYAYGHGSHDYHGYPDHRYPVHFQPQTVDKIDDGDDNDPFNSLMNSYRRISEKHARPSLTSLPTVNSDSRRDGTVRLHPYDQTETHPRSPVHHGPMEPVHSYRGLAEETGLLRPRLPSRNHSQTQPQAYYSRRSRSPSPPPSFSHRRMSIPPPLQTGANPFQNFWEYENDLNCPHRHQRQPTNHSPSMYGSGGSGNGGGYHQGGHGYSRGDMTPGRPSGMGGHYHASQPTPSPTSRKPRADDRKKKPKGKKAGKKPAQDDLEYGGWPEDDAENPESTPKQQHSQISTPVLPTITPPSAAESPLATGGSDMEEGEIDMDLSDS
ncbi:Zinc finger CCHC domain-containing protein 8 [Dimargaris cristalligena]|uniref:CCHC-type domain-containing protein n=1 Tax=Dimargaris cristalligena TaxID=215637 RepID=A0A4V1J4M6_9FUNG|nr:Zinc finger CCHC domain-containing protein 8 [Dimargaris cristalligena]RKP36089.1 hypothetical protein BJ085DRAFT_34630 [Dimargaris cristalligena]|eukprot:RKP36089.1 hypothetical protein BJ085DRAFT_34630 [Dimargaris cristalligena]